jgi:hypothetical protein
MPKEKEKEKEKKEKLIYRDPPVMCECGVQSNYGLVPSGLGIGYYCGIWLITTRLVSLVHLTESYYFIFFYIKF